MEIFRRVTYLGKIKGKPSFCFSEKALFNKKINYQLLKITKYIIIHVF